ncbi:MAG: hypothetical protein HZA64_08045 [Rhodocyclales bacterium]|nr:hypothetical protein [Rhodocyclales bacterium]
MRRIHMRCRSLLTLTALAVVLAGCEIPGMGDDPRIAEAKEADGKAVGGACRHSGRALEDCYVMNPKALRSAVYAGWRDMDAYMRENNIRPVVPDLVDAPTGGEEAKPAEPPKAPENEKKAGAKRSAAPEDPEPPRPRRFT